jgi:hypothetical protein
MFVRVTVRPMKSSSCLLLLTQAGSCCTGRAKKGARVFREGSSSSWRQTVQIQQVSTWDKHGCILVLLISGLNHGKAVRQRQYTNGTFPSLSFCPGGILVSLVWTHKRVCSVIGDRICFVFKYKVFIVQSVTKRKLSKFNSLVVK